MSASGAGERNEAVALRYERGSAAPRVVAKGAGRLAESIVALAAEHGVPIREDRDLVALLSAVELGDEIPPEMYAVVAELLAWLHRCNGELAPRLPRGIP
jgi:flagellar biosynthesis protein